MRRPSDRSRRPRGGRPPPPALRAGVRCPHPERARDRRHRNPWFAADIAIAGDRIVRIGRLGDATARRVVDATGMYVSPGFIDLHSHADRAMTSEHLEARRAKSLNSQGLTTVIGGPDGRNQVWPLSAEIAALRELGHAMNFVPMVGHSTVRAEVMGNDYWRAATEDEIARMQALVREGMEAGAWGLGAGVEYRPPATARRRRSCPRRGRGSLRWLLRRAPAQRGGHAVVGAAEHRDGLARGREPGAGGDRERRPRNGDPRRGEPPQGAGRSSFGRSGQDTLVMNRAREEGLEVYLDVYPYETFGGGARPMIPRWSLVHDTVDTSGGRDSPVYNRPGVFDGARAHLERRWADPELRGLIARDIEWIVDHNGGPDRVVVVGYPDSTWVGRTLEELGRRLDITYEEVVVHMALNGYPEVLGGAWTRGYGIHDADVINYYRQDYTATASDAAVSGVEGVPEFASRPGAHPRHFGAFTRKIARYVKDLKAITLPFAIRSMTGLPARIIGLEDRGFLREGYGADLVVFDLERLRDRATVLEPDLFSEGVDYVMVNGVFTVDAGEFTDALPGEVILRTPNSAN